MSAVVGTGFWKRLIAGQLTIDESTAVSMSQEDPKASRVGFWVTGASIYVGWNTATALGAMLGDALGDVSRFGLDAAAAAAFLGLLWPRIHSLQPIAVAAVAAVVTVLAVPTLPAGIPILVAAAAGLVVAQFFDRKPA
jgi:predicted branched-subunit amino acid permease